MEFPIYELKIQEDLQDDAEVSYIALVDKPAIQKDFIAFGIDNFVEPSTGERKDDFLPRCISYVINEGKENEQAVAICNSIWEQHFVGQKVSFDYDDTLSTERGKELAVKQIKLNNIVYIISARQDKEGMLSVAKELGIPESRIYATGSNKAKVEKIKELGINKHYDNNIDVINDLGSIGSKFEESYNDYPQSAKDDAERGIKLNEKIGNKCATQVGKVRAQQIMNGENISKETIKRTYSFLSRAAEYYNPEDTEACGTISYLLWGGESMLRWCESKMNNEDFKTSMIFSIQNEDKHIISGPLMLADELIYRNNKKFGEHYVKFSAETIKEIAIKFAKKGYQQNVNLMHSSDMKLDGFIMFESFIVDKSRGILPMEGFEEAKDGSWFGSFYVENPKAWELIKEGKVKGFSVEGFFDYVLPEDRKQSYAERKLAELAEMLKVPYSL